MTSEVFNGPVWVQAIRVPDYLEEAAMRTLVLRSPARTGHRTVYSWPRAMFAELATNAILHKDYSRPNYVGIYVYADRMTFVNHNRPLPPVTIEDLNERESFDGRGYVNPELKDMFFALGLIESFGSGVRRAKHAMRDNGSPRWSTSRQTMPTTTRWSPRQSSRSSWRMAAPRHRVTNARRQERRRMGPSSTPSSRLRLPSRSATAR